MTTATDPLIQLLRKSLLPDYTGADDDQSIGTATIASLEQHLLNDAVPSNALALAAAALVTRAYGEQSAPFVRLRLLEITIALLQKQNIAAEILLEDTIDIIARHLGDEHPEMGRALILRGGINIRKLHLQQADTDLQDGLLLLFKDSAREYFGTPLLAATIGDGQRLLGSLQPEP